MGIIERYRKYLPVTDSTPVISIEEGGTPLIKSGHLSDMLGSSFNVWLKYEALNPTGSFKDRGMTMAVSKALEEGSAAVACASTGNTSASAAAYAARAKMKCIVVIPEGAIAMGKLAQALIHGAKVIAIRGNFDEALKIVRELTDNQRGSCPAISVLKPDKIVIRRDLESAGIAELAAHSDNEVTGNQHFDH